MLTFAILTMLILIFIQLPVSLIATKHSWEETTNVNNRLEHLENESIGVNITHNNSNSSEIIILGLYELSTLVGTKGFSESLQGKSELQAAQIAVGHVNQLGLADGYKLKLIFNDTKCDPGFAVDTFFHTIFYRKVKFPILLGSACSEATERLANIVPYWNMIQISHGATSPVLQDRKQFPSFYRVVASDASHNAARLAFIQAFHWQAFTVISQDEKEYTLAVNDLVKTLEKSNITCRGMITFSENDFLDQLQQLKDLDTRIIIPSFSTKVAPKIFCKVYELGMFGSDYVWIFPAGFDTKWWRTNNHCPKENLAEATRGIFAVTAFHSGGITDIGFNERDLEAVLKRSQLPLGNFARESYDAVWVAAKALNKSLQDAALDLAKFDYQGEDISKRLFQEIADVHFNGVSGPIYFQGANRIGTTVFLRLQDESWQVVASYSPDAGGLNFTCRFCQPIAWSGGQVPVAQRFLKFRIETIDPAVFLAACASTGLAIMLACLFLGFNLYFRKLKFIKLSSPRLNNIAVVGCIAVYFGVILLGIDDATNPFPSYFPILCTAKVYLFAGGFSLAFGSIFAKTYRIHKIFTGSHAGSIKKKFLQDTQLILLVCALLLIDGLVLTVWVVTDPLQRQLHNLTLVVSETDRSVIYMPQIEVCSCSYLNVWLSFLYGYKGLQLIVGVYMAWETRHVKIPVLNDSQYIGMSVYGVVITSCIVVVLANVISERPSIAYSIISTMILTTTTAMLCLLFVPKVIAAFSRSAPSDPVMQSMGLKLECNTRRFVTEDSKEKLFRLEVQNRVFRRELLLLRVECRRLEKELNLPVSPTDSSFSLEIASYKGTQMESQESQPYTKPEPMPSEPISMITKLDLPRCSWPSEALGSIRLGKVAPFRSNPNLEVDAIRPSVIGRLRQLIRSKRVELRKMPHVEVPPNQSEIAKRKFSLTMCLQAQRQRQANKDIIIDLGLSSEEVEQLLCKTKDEGLRKRRRTFHHQASYPTILLSVTTPQPVVSNNSIATAASLPALEDGVQKEEPDLEAMGGSRSNTGKCRSLEENIGLQMKESRIVHSC